MTSTSVAILGAGRAGCSLYAALEKASYSGLFLWTRSESSARNARQEGFELSSEPLEPDSGAGEAIREADLLILAVSDPAVGALAQELARSGLIRQGQVVAHLAGALDLSPLKPALEAQADVGSVHPLASLATRRAPLAGFSAAIASSSERAKQMLEKVSRDAGLLPFQAIADRALHHAACCIVGNFPQVLLGAAMDLWISSGLDEETARQALGPLLVGAAENALKLGPSAGLTGPVARADARTVERHLAALGSHPHVDSLYREASTRAVHLASQSKAPSEELARIRKMLTPSKP